MRRFACLLLLPLTLGFGWEGRVVRLERELDTADPARRAEVVRLLGAYGDRGGPGVLRALEDVDVDVRVEAAAVAGTLRLHDAEPRLASFLDEPEMPLREAAVSALAALGDVRAVPAIVRALGDTDARVRRAAVGALGALGTLPPEAGALRVDCVVPVLGRLDDDDPQVRAEAAEVLAQLHDARAVVPLVGKARDTAPEVRAAVYGALGALGDHRALAPLLSALDDDDPDARLAAVGALGRLGDADATDALVLQLAKPDRRLVNAATAALAALPGERALAAVAGEVARSPSTLSADASTSIAGAALIARVRATQDDASRAAVVAAIVHVLESGDPARGPSAVLVRIADLTSTAPAAPVLARLFAGPAGRDPIIATALARATADPVATDAAPPAGLVALLESLAGGDPQREEAALAGLDAYFASHAPDGRAADPLISALAHVRRDHRARIVTLLGAVHASRALPALRPLLAARVDGPAHGHGGAAEEAALRRAAVDALGRIGDPGAAPLLLPLLDDPVPETRMLAARALGASASVDTVRDLVARLARPAPTDRHAVLVAFGPALAAQLPHLAAGDRAAAEEALLAAARSDDATLAARAVDAIALASDVELAGPLGVILRDANPTTRIAAVRALGTLLGRTVATTPPDPPGIPGARRALDDAAGDDDPDVRVAALGVAGELDRPGGPRANEPAKLAMLLAAAMGAQGPASSAAAFALARLARRGLLATADAPRLCSLLTQREPYVRANAMIALAALRAGCPGSPAPVTYLGSVHAEAVREAAARWAFAATPSAPETLDALARCASGDPSEHVAATCAEPAMPPLDDVADVTAWDADGRRPLARTLVAVRLADGSALVARTDANAHVLLLGAPRGPLAIDDPLDVPLDPP